MIHVFSFPFILGTKFRLISFNEVRAALFSVGMSVTRNRIEKFKKTVILIMIMVIYRVYNEYTR